VITKEELLEFLKTETFALQVARKSFNELIGDLMDILNNPEIPEGTKEVIQGVWELLQDLDLRPWDYVEVIEYWGKLLSEKGERVKPRSFFTEILFRMVEEV
jgi:hypothetical protein